MPRRRRDEPVTLPESVSRIISTEDIYPIINYVQMAREKISFVANHSDSITIETLIKDTNIPFTKKELRKGVRFYLGVPPERGFPDERFSFDDDEDDDYLDELIEEGQCF